MKGRRRDSRIPGNHGYAERFRVERRARAMSHLERVRGLRPRRRPGAVTFAAAVVASIVAGAALGTSFSKAAAWLGHERRIASMNVRGARHLSADEIAQASGVPRSGAVSAVEPAAVAKQLTQHGWIAEAQVLPLPTGILVVSVTEREPLARVAGTPLEPVYLVDASGTPFAPAGEVDATSLPLVRMTDAFALHAPNESIAGAVRVARELPHFGLPAPLEVGVAAENDPRGLSLALDGVTPRIVLGREGFETKLEALARLLAAEVPEIANSSELDLRFTDQAILRSEPSPEETSQAATARGHAPPST